MENWREKTCHDCGCKPGELHELGCDMEICSFCGGQLISCRCLINDRIPYQSPEQPGVADNVWPEFLHSSGMCSLCGNSGYIDTRGQVKTADGLIIGARSFCICPNGRALKRGRGGETWNPSRGSSIISQTTERDPRNNNGM